MYLLILLYYYDIIYYCIFYFTIQGATPLFVLVATCLDQIVGVAILRHEEFLDFLQAHYNIEDFVYFNYHRPEDHGHLHHFILNPVFHCLGRHFLTVSSMDCWIQYVCIFSVHPHVCTYIYYCIYVRMCMYNTPAAVYV